MPRVRGKNNMLSGQKGCSCKKSGCLKNYCECYEAKILCSDNCKCIGCGNIQCPPGNLPKVKKTIQSFDSAFGPAVAVEVANDENLITSEILDGLSMCLVAQLALCKDDGLDQELTRKMVAIEVRKCITQLNDFILKMKRLN